MAPGERTVDSPNGSDLKDDYMANAEQATSEFDSPATSSVTGSERPLVHTPGDGHIWLMVLGDLIIFGSATNRYHIGIVQSVNGSTVHVISGNTANPSNSSQEGVYNKSYSLSSSVFYGLVRA